jgi:hypothetical protein
MMGDKGNPASLEANKRSDQRANYSAGPPASLAARRGRLVFRKNHRYKNIDLRKQIVTCLPSRDCNGADWLPTIHRRG